MSLTPEQQTKLTIARLWELNDKRKADIWQERGEPFHLELIGVDNGSFDFIHTSGMFYRMVPENQTGYYIPGFQFKPGAYLTLDECDHLSVNPIAYSYIRSFIDDTGRPTQQEEPTPARTTEKPCICTNWQLHHGLWDDTCRYHNPINITGR